MYVEASALSVRLRSHPSGGEGNQDGRSGELWEELVGARQEQEEDGEEQEEGKGRGRRTRRTRRTAKG